MIDASIDRDGDADRKGEREGGREGGEGKCSREERYEAGSEQGRRPSVFPRFVRARRLVRSVLRPRLPRRGESRVESVLERGQRRGERAHVSCSELVSLYLDHHNHNLALGLSRAAGKSAWGLVRTVRSFLHAPRCEHRSSRSCSDFISFSFVRSFVRSWNARGRGARRRGAGTGSGSRATQGRRTRTRRAPCERARSPNP